MIQNFISMNGFGLFVWSSFIVTFLSCACLYLKTYKTLKKSEREYAKEIQELPIERRKIILENSKIASQVLSSYNKVI